jgi:hypothetical protein
MFSYSTGNKIIIIPVFGLQHSVARIREVLSSNIGRDTYGNIIIIITTGTTALCELSPSSNF